MMSESRCRGKFRGLRRIAMGPRRSSSRGSPAVRASSRATSVGSLQRLSTASLTRNQRSGRSSPIGPQAAIEHVAQVVIASNSDDVDSAISGDQRPRQPAVADEGSSHAPRTRRIRRSSHLYSKRKRSIPKLEGYIELASQAYRQFGAEKLRLSSSSVRVERAGIDHRGRSEPLSKGRSRSQGAASLFSFRVAAIAGPRITEPAEDRQGSVCAEGQGLLSAHAGRIRRFQTRRKSRTVHRGWYN